MQRWRASVRASGRSSMTSFAFILGCVPSDRGGGRSRIAANPGRRRSSLGCPWSLRWASLIIPVLFVVIERLAGKETAPHPEPPVPHGGPSTAVARGEP